MQLAAYFSRCEIGACRADPASERVGAVNGRQAGDFGRLSVNIARQLTEDTWRRHVSGPSTSPEGRSRHVPVPAAVTARLHVPPVRHSGHSVRAGRAQSAAPAPAGGSFGRRPVSVVGHGSLRRRPTVSR